MLLIHAYDNEISKRFHAFLLHTYAKFSKSSDFSFLTIFLFIPHSRYLFFSFVFFFTLNFGFYYSKQRQKRTSFYLKFISIHLIFTHRHLCNHYSYTHTHTHSFIHTNTQAHTRSQDHTNIPKKLKQKMKEKTF